MCGKRRGGSRSDRKRDHPLLGGVKDFIRSEWRLDIGTQRRLFLFTLRHPFMEKSSRKEVRIKDTPCYIFVSLFWTKKSCKLHAVNPRGAFQFVDLLTSVKDYLTTTKKQRCHALLLWSFRRSFFPCSHQFPIWHTRSRLTRRDLRPKIIVTNASLVFFYFRGKKWDVKASIQDAQKFILTTR